MALSTAKLTTEFSTTTLTTFPRFSTNQPRFSFLLFKPISSSSSSIRPTKFPKTTSRNSNSPNQSSWIKKWPNPPPNIPHKQTRKPENPKPDPIHTPTTAIDRIVLRLRNLGLGSDSDNEEEEEQVIDSKAFDFDSNEKLGDLLKRDWIRPDTILDEYEDEEESGTLLPWERGGGGEVVVEEEEGVLGNKRRVMRAPSLAELTIQDEELRRLRRIGMTLRERVSVPKAGITGVVLEKIHDAWRKCELVRLKFHEELAWDMKTAHEIVERRTRGLVIWRSGSVMVVFRGTNYEGPNATHQRINSDNNALFIPSSPQTSISQSGDGNVSVLEMQKLVIPRRIETEEEAEYNSLLDGLGPRFEDWWGIGVLPVDADLLPPTVPGYKTPFRLLPTSMRSRLTNAEMTNLRKIAKSLPCHFALGRNRNHQGLATSIVKLWEKSLIVKIAVKRGIQNTNNKIMSEELKNLTGGVLLLRNKYYIVMYRGKDFLPPTVATALAERQEMTKQIQDVEEKVRVAPTEVPVTEGKEALAGTLAEFYEAQARWGTEVSAEEHKKMLEEASRAARTKVVRRLEHKVALAQAKKQKAEKLLSKIVESWLPASPFDDQETITDEERSMYRKVGLRMKAYLPLGIRGVFDGVIENMHLHWKHRELVKLISKEKGTTFVEETARLLEYESGGILVAIERVPKGHALVYYRGKNYRRPISIRPRNLLTKAKALKRRVALQRYEALSQHISELESTIEQINKEIGNPKDVKNSQVINSPDKWSDHDSELNESEDEASLTESDEDDWEDEDDEDSDSGFED